MADENRPWHVDGVRFLNSLPGRFLNRDPYRQQVDNATPPPGGNKPKDDATRKSQSLPRVPADEKRVSGGERELNIVVMGDSGVGKTGEWIKWRQNYRR